jgi:predicted dehydrogenase
VGIANATGPSAMAAANRFSADFATTDPQRVFDSPDVEAVVIATRHDSHAELTVRALHAGKHVFVEKPLAITPEQLSRVEAAAAASDGILMVGFNRRFAPLAERLRLATAANGPVLMTYRVNAGPVPLSHWTRDPDIGGGRILGEVCHFVDFAAFLAGAPPIRVAAFPLEGSSEPRQDNVAALLNFADGSTASIVYTSLGDRSLTKERVEVFGHRGAAVLDDFVELSLHTGDDRKRIRKRGKGHSEEIETFLRACARGEQPWPVADMIAVMRATFDINSAVNSADAAAE